MLFEQELYWLYVVTNDLLIISQRSSKIQIPNDNWKLHCSQWQYSRLMIHPKNCGKRLEGRQEMSSNRMRIETKVLTDLELLSNRLQETTYNEHWDRRGWTGMLTGGKKIWQQTRTTFKMQGNQVYEKTCILNLIRFKLISSLVSRKRIGH